MEKFKIGDRVRCIKKINTHIDIGETAFITMCHGKHSRGELKYYRIGHPHTKGDKYWYECIEYIKPVETEEKQLLSYGVCPFDSISICKSSVHELNKLLEEDKKDKKTIMSKIMEFAKNLVLSADEKLLRKHDLKDSCGEYTEEAEVIVMQKIMKDNEEYLISIAKQLEEETKSTK